MGLTGWSNRALRRCNEKGRGEVLLPRIPMDVFTKLKREKFLREVVLADAVESFHEMRKVYPEVDPFDVAREAGMAALAFHSAQMGVSNEAEGRKLAQSYMRMCEAEFAVEIQNLPKPVAELVH